MRDFCNKSSHSDMGGRRLTAGRWPFRVRRGCREARTARRVPTIDLVAVTVMPRPADDQTNRDSAKFAEFVREFEPGLSEHVARIYAEQDARAIVADAFAVAWRRFSDIPMNRAEQWLKSTAYHSARNLRRSDKRWRSLQAAARIAARTSLSAVDDESRLEAHVVALGLSQLSADDRDLLRLQACEDPSTEELAEILGISPAAARTRLSRARQRLQDACERLLSEGSV